MAKQSGKTASVALVRSSAAEYLTFVAASGAQETSVEMRYEDENIWLTQKMMATLYEVDVRTINEHLKKIFADGELVEGEPVIRNFRITASDGKRYNTKHYNLQAIIAVGFKVNNSRAVQFRKWAGQIVKDYTIQGWTMDVERLKKGHLFTDEYFERQQALIREIRLSERKFYQKVTDLYATAFDYDSNAQTTREFFALVQNKLHWAVHRHTAAELIMERADAGRQNMGLTSWESAPRQDCQIRRVHCQELSEHGRAGVSGAHRLGVSGFWRAASGAENPHVDGRLGQAIGWFSGIQRQRDSHRSRQDFTRASQTARRDRVREIPRRAGQALRERF